MISVGHLLALGAVLFCISLAGIFLNRKNVIVLLMSIELMLLSVNINFVAFSAFLHDLVGQVFAMFVLTVAAAEAAIGLAILVIFFRRKGTIAVDDADRLQALLELFLGVAAQAHQLGLFAARGRVLGGQHQAHDRLGGGVEAQCYLFGVFM